MNKRKIILIFLVLLFFSLLIGAFFYLRGQKNNLYLNQENQQLNTQEYKEIQTTTEEVKTETEEIQTTTVEVKTKTENQNNLVKAPEITTSLPQVSTQRQNTYTLDQVKKNNSKENCWSVIRGKVYDLTNWIDKHPGGADKILNICGKDGTEFFVKQHGGKEMPENALKNFEIGVLK